MRAARAREKLERENREKEEAITRALAEKEALVVQLRAKVESMEASHSRDLQVCGPVDRVGMSTVVSSFGGSLPSPSPVIVV